MLLETIRCVDGEPLYLSYHQNRLDQSLQALGCEATYDLHSLITPPDSNLYRCRFLYNEHGYVIEFHPYAPRTITSLRLITCDNLEYSLKYADRERLNALYEKRERCDDVLIVKNNLLCDTTVANVALYIEGQWITPELPLLKGTTRERLLTEGFLISAPLTPEDIEKATKVGVMNAMVGFIEVENGIII